MSEAKDMFIAACRARVCTLLEEIHERDTMIEKIRRVMPDEDLGGVVRDHTEGPDKKSPRRKSPKAKPTGKSVSSMLADRAAVVLAKHRGPMKNADLLRAIKRNGYTFHGKNEAQALYATLKKDDRFESVSRGHWGIKK